MAEAKANKVTKKRQLKKAETVRERSERSVTPKKRRVTQGVSAASKPFRAIGSFIVKVLRPFAFLLVPFKTKPARLVGRVLASILLFRYIRESWRELRQVEWPTARQTIRLTTAVFVFSILFGSIIAVTDYGLDKVFKKVFID